MVKVVFKGLDRGFNVCVMAMANRYCPLGYSVVPDAFAPSSLEELKQYYKEHGRIAVSDINSDNTIYGCPETNYAFRAWHDAVHLANGYEFDQAGEALAAERQCSDIRALYGNSKAIDRWCDIVRAEVVGQAQYFQEHGEFPKD